jgi:hypothetical protein
VDKINMRFVQSKGSPWNAFPIESTHIDVSDYDESFSFSTSGLVIRLRGVRAFEKPP